jgi:hypothetical protein
MSGNLGLLSRIGGEARPFHSDRRTESYPQRQNPLRRVLVEWPERVKVLWHLSATSGFHIQGPLRQLSIESRLVMPGEPTFAGDAFSLV